jgi:uncharacterized membrane protein YfcA
VTWFLVALFGVAVLGGATAAIAGFGIGSLLTPFMASRFGMTVAIAAVAIPHALATALRCWRLRAAIDWSVMRRFGLLSAAGGLAGALLYARFTNRTLTIVLALLLLATAVAGLSRWAQRVRMGPAGAGVLGVVSGLFGGVAGNQGGLRAAALLVFGMSPIAFVATSTATGLLVDAARMPIYLWRSAADVGRVAIPVLVASVGVIVGTFAGERILLGMSVDRFRILVSALIGSLGLWLLFGLAN